jgi:hypothetical protein
MFEGVAKRLARSGFFAMRSSVQANLFFRMPKAWMVALLAPALLIGCAHHPNKVKSEAKQVGLKETEYRKLKTAAETGDKGAAEKLARLWYQGSDDSAQALYWLDVAANNGSKKAAQIAEFARPKLAED